MRKRERPVQRFQQGDGTAAHPTRALGIQCEMPLERASVRARRLLLRASECRRAADVRDWTLRSKPREPMWPSDCSSERSRTRESRPVRGPRALASLTAAQHALLVARPLCPFHMSLKNFNHSLFIKSVYFRKQF